MNRGNYIALSIMFFLALAVPSMAYTITGDTITYSGAYGSVSQTPYILSDLTNYPVINFTSNFSTPQTLDVAFGFDVPNAVPSGAEYYNPHTENISRSYTCIGSFNYTANHFWCYGLNNQSQQYLMYEHDFETGNITTKTAYWSEPYDVTWTDITNLFTQVSYDYNEKNTWYLISGVNFNPSETKTIRAKVNVLPNTNGKYDIFIKRTSDSFASALSSGNYVLLDPWWNNSFSKKVLWTNTTAAKTISYQTPINVTYDADMQADFDDLRFVNSTETGVLNYFLENKSDSNWAYVWVGTNATTFYMYYGNSTVTSASNGKLVFPLFDDFNDASYNNTIWTTTLQAGGVVIEAGGNLSLYASGWTDVKSNETYGNTVCAVMSVAIDTSADANNGWGFHGQYYGVPIVSFSWTNPTGSVANSRNYIGSALSSYNWGGITNRSYYRYSKCRNGTFNTVDSFNWANNQNLTLSGNDAGALSTRASILTNTKYMFIDYWFIRNYTGYDDTQYSAGAEESNATVNATLIKLYVNGVEANATHSYTGATDNITATINVTGLWVAILQNGTVIANGTNSIQNINVTASGYWNYTAYGFSNSTWTQSSATLWMNVSKGQSNCTLSVLPATPIYYETSTTAVCGCSGDVTSNLYINGTLNNTLNNTAVLLAAAVTGSRGYNFTCNSSTVANWTGSTNSSNYLVSQKPNSINVTFNTTSPAIIGSIINVSCNRPQSLSGFLYNNTSLVATNASYIWNTAGLSPTAYSFLCDSGGVSNENYTATTNTSYISLLLSGGLLIPAVYDEKSLTSLTFNISVYNSTFSITNSNVTSYNNNTVSGNITVAISRSGYVQRNYYLNIPSNSSVNMTGYLLDSASGVYVTYWAYSANNPLGEVGSLHSFKRFIGSSNIEVGESQGDAQGKGTVYLDPYTNYLIDSTTADGTLTYNISSYNPNPSFIIRIPFSGSTAGVNQTWFFTGTTYQLTPTDVYLRTNVTTFNYTVTSTLSDIQWYTLKLIYWNGTVLYSSNDSTHSAGGSLVVNLNYTSLNGTVTAETFLKKQNYTVLITNRSYIVWSHYSAIPDAISGLRTSGLPNIAQSLIALFVSYGVAMGINRFIRTGSGLIFLGCLLIFTIYGFFSVPMLIGLALIEIGLLMFREVW